jgi:glycosyltransferase involved in cell wall biosynthesis
VTTEVLGGGAHGPNAPSFRIRVRLPAAHLAGHGVRISPASLLTAEEEERFRAAAVAAKLRIVMTARRRMLCRLRASDAGFSVALIQRRLDLLPSRALEETAARGRRLVLDVDDAIWLDTAPEAGGHLLARLKATATKTAWLARRAEHVIAGNDLLAEWLSQFSRSITVVPSLVDHRTVPARTHSAADPVVLGWIGSRSTAPYLGLIRDALDAAVEAAPDVHFELRVMGGPPPACRKLRVVPLEWSVDAERELLARMDIGLMPLPDSPWTRGKCAYKALQYMAAGVPVVTHDVGVSAAVVGDGNAGVVAAADRDWVEALCALGRDPGARETMGAAGRARVARDFSMDSWAPAIASILSGTRA